MNLIEIKRLLRSNPAEIVDELTTGQDKKDQQSNTQQVTKILAHVCEAGVQDNKELFQPALDTLHKTLRFLGKDGGSQEKYEQALEALLPGLSSSPDWIEYNAKLIDDFPE